ncbi:MAG: hypothetical protein ACYCPQ_04000 [Elusimicrobiota bacterium]
MEDEDWKTVHDEALGLIREDPVPAFAWGALGLSLIQLGKNRDARHALETALAFPNLSPSLVAGLLKNYSCLI